MSLGTDTAMQHVGTDGFERHDGGTDGRAGRWVHMDFALGSYGIDMDFALGSYFCFQHVGTLDFALGSYGIGKAQSQGIGLGLGSGLRIRLGMGMLIGNCTVIALMGVRHGHVRIR